MWKLRKKKKKAKEVKEEAPPSTEEEQTSEKVEETTAAAAAATSAVEETTSKVEDQGPTETSEKTSVRSEGQKTDDAIGNTNAINEKVQTAKEVEKDPFTHKEQQVGPTAEETPLEAQATANGVFIFNQKVEGRLKKFLTALFTIFLLPPILIFALLVITSIILLAFPIILMALPILLLVLCILFIALPIVIPFITVVTLITDKGKVHFGLKKKIFAIKVLGVSFPPYADRKNLV